MVSSPTSGSPDLPPGGDADESPLAANLVGGADQGHGHAKAGRGRQAGGGYSRFVTWTKVLLPFLALILIVLVILWPRLKSDDTFRIGFSSVHLSGEAEPGMDNARYAGTDENRQPFSVTADLARIIPGMAGEVALELPKADLTLEDGTWLVLTADTGRYVREQNTLELKGHVNLFHDTGYEIATEHLRVDLKAGSATGEADLTGHGPFGELQAKGLKLVDKGNVIYFTGPAKLLLYPSQGTGSGGQK
ncbi:LPS export ABC transporter periplasmic protein LptC [Pseudomonadota bacterium]